MMYLLLLALLQRLRLVSVTAQTSAAFVVESWTCLSGFLHELVVLVRQMWCAEARLTLTLTPSRETLLQVNSEMIQTEILLRDHQGVSYPVLYKPQTQQKDL